MVSITSKNDEKVSFWKPVIKGALLALSFSLIAVLIFAFLLRFISVSDSVIKPVNQIIKIISVLIATFIALKKSKEMGLISGLLIGFLYTIVAFLSFSILDGHFEFTYALINDLLFGAIGGAIAGVISVNLKKK